MYILDLKRVQKKQEEIYSQCQPTMNNTALLSLADCLEQAT